MGEIRAFEPSQIRDVAAMQLKIIRQERRPASAAFQQYFHSMFFENPWRCDDLPSLVYLHQGKIAGFLGVIPREMEFSGRRIRVAVATQLMTDRDVYPGFAGRELMKRFLAGPQDLSYSDGATEAAYLCWKGVGAHAATLYCLEWTRVLRQARYMGRLFAERGGGWRAFAGAFQPAAALLDTAIGALPFRAGRAPVSNCVSEEATVEDLLAAIREIGWRDSLRPAYEEKSFHWMMAETERARNHGTLRIGVVRDRTRARAGWFVYFARRGGTSPVLQIGARPHAFDGVLRALLADAWRHGAVAVRGQAIPPHLSSLTKQFCGLKHPWPTVLFHSRHQALRDAILRGDAALSRLDGEWWMRFCVDDWR